MKNINARRWVTSSFKLCGALLALLVLLVLIDSFLSTTWIIGILKLGMYLLGAIFFQAVGIIIIFRSHFT